MVERKTKLIESIISEAHNALGQTQAFYAVALQALSQEMVEIDQGAKAVGERAYDLAKQISIEAGKLQAAEQERDDLRSELCRLRSQGEAMRATIAELEGKGDGMQAEIERLREEQKQKKEQWLREFMDAEVEARAKNQSLIFIAPDEEPNRG